LEIRRYREEDPRQLTFDDYYLPFHGHLRRETTRHGTKDSYARVVPDAYVKAVASLPDTNLAALIPLAGGLVTATTFATGLH
jgi:hypothetical protein